METHSVRASCLNSHLYIVSKCLFFTISVCYIEWRHVITLQTNSSALWENEYPKHAASSRSQKHTAPVCFFRLNGQTHFPNLRCRWQQKYTVRLLSFRTDCAERILRKPSGGHPQKHVEASLDTLCAQRCLSELSSVCDLWRETKLCVKASSWI